MKRERETKIHQCVCETCQRHPFGAIAKQHRAINRVLAQLDEKNRRRFVGLLALQWRRGSIELLHEITGLSRMTIRRGRAEVQRVDRQTSDRIRRSGAGRQASEKKSRRF
jgi:hypothetical protein